MCVCVAAGVVMEVVVKVVGVGVGVSLLVSSRGLECSDVRMGGGGRGVPYPPR